MIVDYDYLTIVDYLWLSPLYKLINQQEGILAYKVINGTYLLGDILTDRHELDHYTNLEIMKI